MNCRRKLAALGLAIILIVNNGGFSVAFSISAGSSSIDPGVPGISGIIPLPAPEPPRILPRMAIVRSSSTGYFGDGRDGDLYIGAGQTVVLPVDVPYVSVVEKNYKSVYIEAGGTLTTAAPNAGLIIKSQGNVIIKGTIDQSEKAPVINPSNNYVYPAQLSCGAAGNGGQGGAGITGTDEYHSPGAGGQGMAGRVYGGGYGGGGGGGTGKRDGYYPAHGSPGGSATATDITQLGSLFQGGKGTMPGSQSPSVENHGKNGGGGGGGLTSYDSLKGGDGGTGAGAEGQVTYGGGGGGAGALGGGVVVIYCGQTLQFTGSILCKGGAGGKGGNQPSNNGAYGSPGGGGGGGGGGSVYMNYAAEYTNTGNIDVSAGAGGAKGSNPLSNRQAVDGSSGAAGTFVVERAPDTTPPTISGVTVSSTWGATNTATIAATDDITGVSSYAVTSAASAPASGWQSAAAFTISANGTYYAWAKDGLGNVSAGKAFTVSFVDTYPPVIDSVSVTPTGFTTAATKTITVAARDGQSGLASYSISTSGSPGSWQAGNTFSKGNGTYYVFAKDNAGVVSLAAPAIVSGIDLEQPVVTGVVLPPTYTQGNNAITIKATDATSGVKDYAFTTTNVIPTSWQVSPTFNFTTNGTYYAWARDNVNRTSSGYSVAITKVPYNILVSPASNGSVLADKLVASVGDTVQLTILPDTGYKLKAGTLKVNGSFIAGTSFTMPAANVVITAEFENIVYNIICKPTANGSVAANKAAAIYQEQVDLTFTIDMGYKLKAGSLRVNGTTISGTSFKMPAADAVVTVEYEVAVFDVLIAPTPHATITTDKSSATFGETVAVTVVPDAGYRLINGSLKVNGIAIVGDSFTMPAGVATVTAELEAIHYRVTVAATPNGTVTVDKATATIGEVVRLTVQPAAGYKLTDGSLKVNSNACTNFFVMPPEDVTVTAEFEPIPYTVTAAATQNGYIAIDKDIAIIGETVTVTYTPARGYRLIPGSLKANGVAITGDSFIMPAANVVVTSAFETIPYSVTVAATPNGTVTVDKATATIGETVTITIAPKPGYKLIPGSIKVNGRTSETVFNMDAENVMITAQFEPIVYTVKLEQSPNGTITTDKTNAVIGNTVTIFVTPDRGYRLQPDSLKVDGVAISGTSFVLGAANATVTVAFEPIPYRVTVASTPNGSVTVDKDTATIGQTVTITTTPDTGYKLVPGSVKANGTTVTGTTFVVDAADIEITAEFEPIVYGLTLQQTRGGTITADRSTAVIGDTITITITPDTGYRFKPNSLKVNGTSIAGNSFVMEAANTLVRAEFEPIGVAGTVKDTTGAGLQGMTVKLSGSTELTTATDQAGNFAWLSVPNGTYTLSASHYRWDTATAQLVIKDGYIVDDSVLQLVCTRDNRLDILEELIRSLPEPLDDASNDAAIKERGTDILYAKALYDELPLKLRDQLDIYLKAKLDKLLIRLAEIEGRVTGNVEGVKATGLEGVIDKSQYVSVDGDTTQKLTVTLQLDTTEEPAELDKMAIDEFKALGKAIGSYMDISLLLQLDDKEPTQITEARQPVMLQVPIPTTMPGSDYTVVRVHNGVAEYLETVESDGQLTFATDKFSTYAIEYTPRRSGGGGNRPTTQPPVIPTPKPKPPVIKPLPPVAEITQELPAATTPEAAPNLGDKPFGSTPLEQPWADQRKTWTEYLQLAAVLSWVLNLLLLVLVVILGVEVKRQHKALKAKTIYIAKAPELSNLPLEPQQQNSLKSKVSNLHNEDN